MGWLLFECLEAVIQQRLRESSSYDASPNSKNAGLHAMNRPVTSLIDFPPEQDDQRQELHYRYKEKELLFADLSSSQDILVLTIPIPVPVLTLQWGFAGKKNIAEDGGEEQRVR